MKKSLELLGEFHQTFFQHTPEERLSRAVDIAQALAVENRCRQRVFWNRAVEAWEVRNLTTQRLPTLQEILIQDWTHN